MRRLASMLGRVVPRALAGSLVNIVGTRLGSLGESREDVEGWSLGRFCVEVRFWASVWERLFRHLRGCSCLLDVPLLPCYVCNKRARLAAHFENFILEVQYRTLLLTFARAVLLFVALCTTSSVNAESHNVRGYKRCWLELMVNVPGECLGEVESTSIHR